MKDYLNDSIFWKILSYFNLINVYVICTFHFGLNIRERKAMGIGQCYNVFQFLFLFILFSRLSVYFCSTYIFTRSFWFGLSFFFIGLWIKNPNEKNQIKNQRIFIHIYLSHFLHFRQFLLLKSLIVYLRNGAEKMFDRT